MRTLILLIGLACTITLPAQNWQLIHPDKQYLFKLNSTDSILEVVRVDSFSTVSNDTIYHLNRFTRYNEALNNYHNFLSNLIGTEVMQKTGSYSVYQNGWHTLNFNDSINIPWLYDTANNISAFIALRDTTTIFNQPDSIVQVQLSNGKTLVVSKTFGVLQVPLPNGDTARLAGVKDSEVHGEFLPGYKEMFDLHPGDVLMYEFSGGDGTQTWGTADNWFGLVKTTITNRQETNDSIIYSTHSLYRNNTHMYGEEAYWHIEQNIFDKQLVYARAKNDFEDAIPYTLYPITASFLDGFYRNDLSGQSFAPNLYRTIDFSNAAGGCIKSVSGAFALNTGNGLDTIMPAQSTGIIFEKQYREGVGLTHYYYMPFEQDQEINLVGWIKDGITTGTITPDYNIISGINDLALQSKVTISPNPASSQIRITSPENLEVSCTNLIGEILSTITVQANTPATFNINHLPIGTYILHFVGQSTTFSRTIVVSR